MSGSEITADEIKRAIGRMKPHERALVRELTEPEQRLFVECFIHFPGCSIEEAVNAATSQPTEQATLDL